MPEPILEHQFNGDLLISKTDQDLAKKVYPDIYHVLEHPSLREEFLKYDGAASRAKWRVHTIGLGAIVLAVAALLGSAIAPLVHHFRNVPDWVFISLNYLEIGGIVGVFVAAGGIALFRQKKIWLRARMISEVIRLWHFQSLICRGKQIDQCCSVGDHQVSKATYRADRETAFKSFLNEWINSPDSHLRELIENPTEGYEMLHDAESQYPADSPVIDMIFQAYKAIRFKHQAHYAGHKLQDRTDSLWILRWPPAVLQTRMQFFTSFCLLISLSCSFLIVLGYFAGWSWTAEPYLPVAIIVLLVMNVAGRAIQDGLAAPEEFQRYNDYAGKIAYLKNRFDHTQDNAGKLQLMVEMERAALEELKGFLRAHQEARFIL